MSGQNQALKVKLYLDKKKYPKLFDLNSDKVDTYVEKMLNIGYDTCFPKVSSTEEHNSIKMMARQIVSLQDSVNNPELVETINNLKSQVDSLLGLDKLSSKKGAVSEDILENIINSRYGDLEYQVVRHIPHSGDGLLTLPSKTKIMTEVKNYTNTVNKNETKKMERDMIEQNIKWGLFVSFNSRIQDCKDLDIKTFQNQGETFTIIYIGHLGVDITRLDIAINLLRLIIQKLDKVEHFPWITSELKQSIIGFQDLADKSYLLLESYKQMEESINLAKDKHYQILYNYRQSIKSEVTELNKMLNNTIEKSILENIGPNISDLLTQQVKGTKLELLVSNLIDVFYNTPIKINLIDDIFVLKKNDTTLANIKLQKKKICINWLEPNVSLTLEPNKLKSNQMVLNTCKLISTM